MKAMVMPHPGGPEVLCEQEVPEPTLRGPHDMLIRMHAAGVNPIDTKLRARGTYYPERLPAILGCDGAGVVEKIGESVERFQPGDAVYFCYGGIGGHPGTYAQYAVVSQYHAARMPDTLDFVQAAGVPLALITAWESLFERVSLSKGQSILIQGGTGGVGHLAVQLALHQGAKVCATVGSAEGAAWLRERGAHSILYREQDVVGAVRGVFPDGVDIGLDGVGGEVFAQTCQAVRDYGEVVTLLAPPADMDWREARTRNLRISLELMLTPMFKHLEKQLIRQAQILREGARLIEEGKLHIHIHQALPLSEAAHAHRLLESGGIRGKLVLVIDG